MKTSLYIDIYFKIFRSRSLSRFWSQPKSLPWSPASLFTNNRVYTSELEDDLEMNYPPIHPSTQPPAPPVGHGLNSETLRMVHELDIRGDELEPGSIDQQGCIQYVDLHRWYNKSKHILALLISFWVTFFQYFAYVFLM